MNDTNSAHLKAAKAKLDKIGKNVKAIVADELKMYMVQNEAWIGVTYSGEAAMMMDQDSHIHYVVPAQGSNLWFDNIVIPKTCKNKEAAYKFINFMLEPKNAAQNANTSATRPRIPRRKSSCLSPSGKTSSFTRQCRRSRIWKFIGICQAARCRNTMTSSWSLRCMPVTKLTENFRKGKFHAV